MKRLYVFSVLVALVCLIGIYCSKKSSDPVPPPVLSSSPLIDSLSGQYAWPDEQLTIYGARFGDTQDSTWHVIIWPDTVDVISWSDTLIETDIPNNLGVTHVTIAADDDTSNAMPFSVFGITSVEPEFVHVGDTIQIHGLGFGGSPHSNTVLIGGVAAQIVSWDYTLIVAIVPEEAGNGLVEVTANGHVSMWHVLGVQYYPYILGIEPDWGPWGTDVEIAGSWFGDEQGLSVLRFEGTLASISHWSDTLIRTEIPKGTTSGEVIVTVDGKTSNGVQFGVFRVIRIEPSTVHIDDTVVIIGDGLGDDQGISHLTINDIALDVLNWSNDRIEARIPQGISSGEIIVQVRGVVSEPIYLSVVEDPVIESVSPDWGPWGADVEILGSWFGHTQGSNIVTFGDAEANVSHWSDTIIIARVPTGAVSGDITLNVAGRASNSIPFKVFRVHRVVPESAEVGDTVIIQGEGFGESQGTGSVTLGTKIPSIIFWSETSIHIVIDDSLDSGHIVVTVDGVNSRAIHFNVLRTPIISNIDPDWGTYGTSMIITGQDFGLVEGDVRFNGTVATVHSWTKTQIVTEFPYNCGSGDVIVDILGYTSNAAPYSVFGIIDVRPQYIEAGDSVAIYGVGFGDFQESNYVTVDDAIPQIAEWSENSILFVAPDEIDSGYVAVSIDGVQSNAERIRVLSIEGLMDLLLQTNVVTATYRGYFTIAYSATGGFGGGGNIYYEYDRCAVLGAGNSTNHPLTWNGTGFSASHSESDPDGSSSYSVGGSLSEDGMTLLQIGVGSRRYSGGHHSAYSTSQGFSAINIILDFFNDQDTIVQFRVFGPSVEQNIASVDLSYNGTDVSETDMQEYIISQTWDNPTCIPEVIVTFYKK